MFLGYAFAGKLLKREQNLQFIVQFANFAHVLIEFQLDPVTTYLKNISITL